MKEDLFLENISNKIKGLRTEKGLSQEKLAYKIGIDRKYASLIEKGTVNISVKILSKVCLGLGISMSDFFKKLDYKFKKFFFATF